MECNKEEAIRAKGIAEKKMQNKDFLGARKIALKAQQLYPDLENISQLIMVCDVHCSAENKVYANEKDWYGILKIKPMADEASIRKQYRKFALLLHPDKNKFAGATDAFRLVGEAQRVLLDRGKRKLHDSICKTSRPTTPNWAPQQANKTASPFTGSNPQHQQPQRQTQPVVPTDQQTFWTACPFCSVSYRFFIEMLNKQIHCQSCKKFFPGIIKSQATPPGTNWSQPAFSQQKEVPNQGAFKTTTQGSCGNFPPKVHSRGNVSSENQTGESVLKTGVSEVARESKADEKCRNMDVKINETGAVGGSKYSGEMDAKRRKQVAESSESCSTDSSSDSEEDIHTVDNGDDCDFGRPLKRPKFSESFRSTEDPLLKQEASKVNEADNHSVHMVEDVNKVKWKESALYEDSSLKGKGESQQANGEIRAMKDKNKSSEANGKSSLNSSPVMGVDTEIYEYPDPDFNNFDKDRRENCFAVGQIWAIYDTLDAMPRFYAQIRKVYLHGFKLLITWLEPDPDDEHEIKWVNTGLPVSCGKFKLGNSENTEVHLMFSHLVSWESGSKRDSYKVYPRKGETWALFKNWDVKWHSDPDSKREYEFEFVEVLSDYSEGIGVSVAYLGKVKGFSCLFCRILKKGMNSFQLPSNQLFRFSHRVPSFQMRSEGRKDVPKGSFELDPASLPAKLEEIAVPEDLKVEAENLHSDISSSESPTAFVEPEIISEVNTPDCQLNKKTQSDPERISSNNCIEDSDATRPLAPYAFEIPEPDFNNFDGEKSVEKFQIGQFWALYCDDDGMPKYYAQIKKIENQPEFILHIRWLVACPLPKNAVQWLDKDMPICCGIFRLQNSRTQQYTEIGAFSHQLRVEHTDKKGVYAIFPRKGEVWALYKNWNAGMTCSDLETCEYDMVEILEENDLEVKVLVLEPVYGFRSVFRAQLKEGLALTMGIVRMELLRFSHQIPAFRLKDEGGGSLRGYWELDTAALPITLLCSS